MWEGISVLEGMGVNGGDVGYITGTYDAQTINFNSSRITTGNSFSTGGGATLNFNATNHITINQASFDNGDAGTQHSYMNFSGSNINVAALALQTTPMEALVSVGMGLIAISLLIKQTSIKALTNSLTALT